MSRSLNTLADGLDAVCIHLAGYEASRLKRSGYLGIVKFGESIDMEGLAWHQNLELDVCCSQQKDKQFQATRHDAERFISSIGTDNPYSLQCKKKRCLLTFW